MTQPLIIAAPFTGTAAAMSSVPDEVFAQEIVGPGLALNPDSKVEKLEVQAPVSGIVTSVFPHAFSIDAGDGKNVLVHLGIDTVSLKGEGFELRTSVGARVRQGEVLIVWTLAPTQAAGLSTMCPVVLVQADQEAIELLASSAESVTAGQNVIRWN